MNSKDHSKTYQIDQVAEGWRRTRRSDGVGRLWRVRESDLEAFLKRGEA